MIVTKIHPGFDQAIAQVATLHQENSYSPNKAMQILYPFEEELIEVLQDIYDEYCPDNELSLLASYIPDQVFRTIGDGGQVNYDCPAGQGVVVNVDEYSGQTCRLLLLPSPARFVLDVPSEGRTVIWQRDND